MRKYLNKNLKVDNIPLNDINTLYHEFFHRKDYEWFYEINESDVVVDIGACVGFFTCLALDSNPKKIYAIEPNKAHLKTLIQNVSEFWIDNGQCQVVPIHAAIGTELSHISNVFSIKEKQDFPMMSFKYCMEKYGIDWIDYLKIDCEGGEYQIFQEENMEFLLNRVKHMAVEFHVRDNPHEWIRVRDTLLQRFNLDQVRFIEHEDRRNAYDDHLLLNDIPKDWSSFMLYITN